MAGTDGKEIWRSAIAGMLGVRKYDKRGNEYVEVVRSGQTVSITTEERYLNQEKAARNPDLDFFKNGQLVPVKLLDTAEDLNDIAANPNLMSETDMRDLFKGNWRSFDAKVSDISNATTIQRMISMAEEGEATVRQLQTLNTRLDELTPKQKIKEFTDSDSDFRAVTPR